MVSINLALIVSMFNIIYQQLKQIKGCLNQGLPLVLRPWLILCYARDLWRFVFVLSCAMHRISGALCLFYPMQA